VDFFLAQQNLLLIAVALGSGLMLAWPAIQKNRAGAAISTSQAVTLMNQQHAVLIDIRPNDQFVAGHIPQARNLPAKDIPQKVNSLPKNKPLIVVCDVGRSASVAAAQLRKLGFTDVSVLEGGLKAWNDAGLPVIAKK
jgi:rhodanese-related sulfurtransferase